jgi:hypothetical protein
MTNTFGRSNRVTLAAIFAAMVVLGCKGTTTTAAASVGESTGGAGATTAPAVATKVVYITDPTLNDMNADSVKIPARWQFKGWLAQEDACSTIPEPIFKATSPDGLTTVELEPVMTWKYGSGPAFNAINQTGCLPMHGPMSALDFLKHYASSLNLTYVGSDQMPPAVERKVSPEMQQKVDALKAQAASMGVSIPPLKESDDRARGIVTSKNGTVAMKGHLDVTTVCRETDTPAPPPQMTRVPIMRQMRASPAMAAPPPAGPSVVTICSATVSYLNAPEAKYAVVSRTFDAERMGDAVTLDPWGNAFMERSHAQFTQNMALIGQMMRQAMAAHAQQFAAQMAAQQASHDQFMDTMNQNFQNSKLINNGNIAARQTAASDVVDYAADRQTVLDPNTGVAYKIPNDVTVGSPLVRAHGDGSPW